MGITVYGAGAIGGAAGAFMALAGEDVTLVDKVPEHVARINETGLRITGKSEEFTIKMPAIEPHQIEGTLDLVLICVKSQDTVASMDAMARHPLARAFRMDICIPIVYYGVFGEV